MTWVLLKHIFFNDYFFIFEIEAYTQLITLTKTMHKHTNSYARVHISKTISKLYIHVVLEC